MLKRIFAVIMLCSFSGSIMAANTWITGDVKYVTLNTDYDNNEMGFTIDFVNPNTSASETRLFTLTPTYWTNESMKKNVLALFLSAKATSTRVHFWGNVDDTNAFIHNRLRLED